MTYYADAPDFREDPRLGWMTEYEIDREEALASIENDAKHGRVHTAWREIRREIQLHFENRPDDGHGWRLYTWGPCWRAAFPTQEEFERARPVQIAKGAAAHAEWLAGLQKLLEVRRSIPHFAAEQKRRMSSWQQAQQAGWNRFIGEAA